MQQRITLLAGAAAFAISAAAFAADTYTIDSRHTFPVFEVNHLGFPPSAVASTRPAARSAWIPPPGRVASMW